MAQRRRRQLRRNVLVFLASTAFHVGLFFIAISEFTYYPPPSLAPAPVQLEIVPPSEQPVPPPPIPRIIVKQQPTPTQTPAPPPTPQPQPPQPPKPQPPARVAAQPAPVQSAPLQAKRAPALAPSPKPTLAQPLAPITAAAPTPTPGPPRVTAPALPNAQSKAFASPHIVLHRNRNEAGAPLAPSVAIPGAVEAPPQQASGAPNGAPGGPSGGGAPGGRGFPAGSLPAFGGGLRGSVLGCANAAALHLSRAEQAKCDEAFGTGAHESPVMDPIGATKRAEIDRQAAAEQAAQRYRDSTPAGSEATPISGQPRILHKPGEE